MLLDISNVSVIPSDGVRASLAHDKRTRRTKNALRVDFQFDGAGYFTARIPVDLHLPANYQLDVKVAGTPLINTLEIKLFDTSGDNVWWVDRPNLAFTKKWQPLANKRRRFSYAWGPSRDPISQVKFVELTVTAVSGGQGSVYFAGLDFKELPVDVINNNPPKVTASSGEKSASNVLRRGNGTWRSSARQSQHLNLDFGYDKEFGGLVVDWGAEDFAVDYDVQLRRPGHHWHTVDTTRGCSGKRQYHLLPDGETSAVRLKMLRSSRGRGYEIESVVVKPLEFASSINDFFFAIAPDFAEGSMPRYLKREQSFWTVVGVSGAANEALINEEGMVELGRQMPSIEPFIWQEGELLSWREGTHQQSLQDGYLPIPTVTRIHPNLSLAVTLCAQGEANNSTMYARYHIANYSALEQSGRLLLAIRPFQVNPPWQFLNTPGGFSPINQIGRTETGVEVNGTTAVIPCQTETAFGATRLSNGDIVEHLREGCLPSQRAIEDDRGFSSAALQFDFKLAPGESASFYVAVPFSANASVRTEDPQAVFEETAQWWRNKLDSVKLELTAEPELSNTVKSQVAYILINREGPAIQPGKRCYRRTWIRDGALTATALLQQGCIKEVEDFIRWFAPYIYESGKVPCCVDQRGASPIPENDSHGEFIYLVAEYYRHTGDKQLLQDMLPYVVRVAHYIDQLRQTQRTDDYKTGDKAHLFGLLPPSISHEGYSAKPAFSYFDDIFADVGLRDAAFVAEALEDSEAFATLSRIRDEFHADLIASINNTMVYHKIDFVPGAADLGDFDSTSETIALDPDNLLPELPAALQNTFARYWDYFVQRRDGQVDWDAFVPYEWRNAGSFIRLGQQDKAHAVLEFMIKFRRPAQWNHWAEVACKDELAPRFIGDAPHGWVGSDFLRSVRSFFVYETDEGLLIGKGLSANWLIQGVNAPNLRTHYGTLSLKAHTAEDQTTFVLDGGVSMPVILSLPEQTKSATVNGRVASIDTTNNTVVVDSLPAQVVCTH